LSEDVQPAEVRPLRIDTGTIVEAHVANSVSVHV